MFLDDCIDAVPYTQGIVCDQKHSFDLFDNNVAGKLRATFHFKSQGLNFKEIVHHNPQNVKKVFKVCFRTERNHTFFSIFVIKNPKTDVSCKKNAENFLENVAKESRIPLHIWNNLTKE